MEVASAIEVYTTLFGWIMYDAIWDILTETGIAYLFFFGMIVRAAVQSYTQAGAVEGANASLRNIEVGVISMMLVAALAGTPVMTLRTGDLGHTRLCAGQSFSSGRTGTAYDSTFAAISGRTGQVPVWWYGILMVANGITNAVIASVPCTPDIRTLDYRINNTRIADPELRRQIELFANDCWLPARAQFLTSHATLPDVYAANDIDWPGSQFFLDSNGYYRNANVNLALRASETIPGFAYDRNRDTEYQPGFEPLWGRPVCADWWTEPNVGIRARMLAQINPLDLQSSRQTVVTTDPGVATVQMENDLVRKLFEPERIELTQGAPASGGPAPSFRQYTQDKISAVVANAGLTMDYLSWKPKIYAMKQMAPIAQSYILMALYMLLAFVVVLSGFSIETTLLVSMVIFALKFCSALWAMATWLDDNMITALGLSWWKFDFDTQAGVAGNVAILGALILYIGMPGVWLLTLSIMGYRFNMIGGSMESLTEPVARAADKGTSHAAGFARRLGGSLVKK
ncbi:conjugal transfer protein TraG N-terminal domain-containing protein [Methyloterricola oryzae]|uniref:conjugal transfer protein TraG N-terminal domain-containing protein n=1 Tax=Methyloterricola oryzae TaxID=1495050 RepID=UPI0005EB7403|nr:conjugal transfer protein TraG N-terminal domain-containing protein [Methyloterricola oryzae]